MTACPGELAFARAVSDGADAALEAHLAACASCHDAWHGQRRAIELAQQLAVPMPSVDRREELRTAILAAGAQISTAAPTRPRARWFAGAGLAAAAALALGLGLRGHAATPRLHAHGTVHAQPGARYVASTSPDEIVTLDDGTITVEVTPLHRGERFRVVTADAEVEVRGTAFDVDAHLGHLVGVKVHHGVVEVRPQGGPATTLLAGESWAAPVRAAAAPTGPTPTPIATPNPIPDPSPIPNRSPNPNPNPNPIPNRNPIPNPIPNRNPIPRRSPSSIAASPTPPIADTAAPPPAATPSDPPARPPQALAYDQAWSAMRAGRFSAAATAFARAAVLDPDGALAEDASYWYAVALARAHRTEAITAFRELLDRYPRSPHAGEASAMLGWLLVDADQRVEAARRFRVALDDPGAAVRASARAGLAALGSP